uniref:SFRICE_000692 n=1 Tax=Spodoptera frugiperda TaxID=7108 RepID=A0A2H1V1N9_SPOFR
MLPANYSVLQQVQAIQYVKSRTGTQMILMNHYTYCLVWQSPTKGTTHWRCSSHNGKKCKAKLITDTTGNITGNMVHTHTPYKYAVLKGVYIRIGVKFIESKRGRPLLLLDNYTYSLSSSSQANGTNRWVCTSRSKKQGCKAKVILSSQREIVAVDADHCHPPPEYYYHNGDQLFKNFVGYVIIYKNSKFLLRLLKLKFAFTGVKFIKSKRGRPLLFLNNYTYNLTYSSQAKGTKRWVCTLRSQKKYCKASVVLNSRQEIMTVDADHNHPPPEYHYLNGKYFRIQ